MSQVFRYPVYGPDVFEITVPRGSRPVFFGWQEERQQFSVWYHAADTDEEHVERLQFVATGQHIDLPNPAHVGSVVMPDGFHVFHLFAARPPESEESEHG